MLDRNDLEEVPREQHQRARSCAVFHISLTSKWAPPGTRGGFLASPVLINCPFDKATYVSFCTAAMNRVLPSPPHQLPTSTSTSQHHPHRQTKNSLAIRVRQTKPTFIHGQHFELPLHRRLFRTILDPMSARLATMTDVFRRWRFTFLHLGLLWAILNEVLVAQFPVENKKTTVNLLCLRFPS
jgi:hypothetical protein